MLAGALGLVNACAVTLREGPAVQEQHWPAYLGSSRRAPLSADAPAGNPQPIWRARIGRGISGSPALAEDVLAVSQTDRQVALVERSTGNVIWRRRLDAGLGAGPLLYDDRLFVAEQSNQAKVYALRLDDGRTVWSQRAGDIQAPLLLEGDALYAASLAGTVTKFAAADGRVLWRSRVSGGVRAAPVAVAGGIAVASTRDTLFLLDPSSGTVRARVPTHGTVLGSPALADSLLVVGTAEGWIEAFDATSLQRRWSYDAGGPVMGSVAAWGGSFYAVTMRGNLARVPVAGPAGARQLRTGVVSRAGPMPTRAGVYVVAVNGEVVLIDAEGTKRWSARLDGRLGEPPLVDGHTLIVTTRNGEIVVFR